MTDEELIQNFYEGNREALSMIFERHKEGVFNFAQRMVNNRADAEDAVSDAFGRLCDGTNRFIPNASFKTWFYTIVRNACIDKIRGRKKWASMWFAKTGTNETQEMDFPDQAASAAQTLQNKKAAQCVRDAITKLPVDQREAIILREYNELSYEEIAQILKCSLANVKVLIYRARVQLKDNIPAFVKEGR